MNDPLQQLRDLHLPDAPHWWPPAPGWWLLTVLLIVAIAAVLRYVRRRVERRRPFKQARAELSILLEDDCADAVFVDRANALIKRALIHGLHRTEAAALSGMRWLDYLDGFMDGPCFARSHTAALGDARFAPALDIDRQTLARDIANLLRRMERRA